MGARSEPLIVGRGMLLLEDFCRETGLSTEVVSSLVSEGTLQGLSYEDGRVAGLFDDVLPSVRQLEDLGFTVRSSYNPDFLRTVAESVKGPGD